MVLFQISTFYNTEVDGTITARYVCPLRDSSNVKTIALNTIYDNICTIIDIYCAKLKYLRVDGCVLSRLDKAWALITY